jgi:nicotinamidase-related amidase
VYLPSLLNLPPTKAAWSEKQGLPIGGEGQLGRFKIRGEAGAALIPALAPIDDEPLIDCAASNPFLKSDLLNLLMKRRTRNLIVMGSLIDGSVHNAVCAANDRGFEVLLLTDTGTAFQPKLVETVIRTTILGGGLFGTVGTSGQLTTSATRQA